VVYGTLGAGKHGPVGIDEVDSASGKALMRNERQTKRVLPENVSQTATSIMETVLTQGTAHRSALDGFAAGKTGTTENYGDAWFVGFDDHYTVAVWVGYPDGVRPMRTEYDGAPVEGGTYPAEIWHDFMVQARDVFAQRHPEAPASTPADPQAYGGGGSGGGGAGASGEGGGGGGNTGGADKGAGKTGNNGGGGGDAGATHGGGGGGQPQQAAPATPAPAPAPSPSGGTGAGGGTSAAPG
jgi:penicillin-binding protein 1A